MVKLADQSPLEPLLWRAGKLPQGDLWTYELKARWLPRRSDQERRPGSPPVAERQGFQSQAPGQGSALLFVWFQLGEDGLLRDGGAVGARIGTAEVDSAFGVAHDGFAVAHGSGEAGHGRDDVAAAREFLAVCVGHAAFDLHVAAVESAFGEARRLERHLHVHVEIDDVGNELGVGLGLIPSAHDAEADGDIAFAHEGGNDGVEWPLVAGERIGLARLKVETLAAIVEGKAGAGSDHAGAVSGVVAL